MHTQNQLQTTGLSYEAMESHAQIWVFLQLKARGHLINFIKAHFSHLDWFNSFIC